MEHYDIGPMLGTGGYAEVFRCVDKRTGRAHAVKVVDKTADEGAEAARHEAEILRSLRHPHIVRVEDLFESDSKVYVVLEMLSGGDLYEKLAELYRYTEAVTAQLVANLVQALAFLHGQGICHRDLKPENLMLKLPVNEQFSLDEEDDEIVCSTPQEKQKVESLLANVVLVDFGFACHFQEGEYELMEPCGTPEFMAPEIVLLLHDKRTQGYNEKCDMWSLGVIVYSMLCGWLPFEADSQSKLFKRIARGKYKFHRRTVWSRISAEAKDFTSQLLRRNPADRPSAAAVLEHPWLTRPAAVAERIPEALSHLRKYNIRQKLAAAAQRQEHGQGPQTKRRWSLASSLSVSSLSSADSGGRTRSSSVSSSRSMSRSSSVMSSRSNRSSISSTPRDPLESARGLPGPGRRAFRSHSLSHIEELEEMAAAAPGTDEAFTLADLVKENNFCGAEPESPTGSLPQLGPGRPASVLSAPLPAISPSRNGMLNSPNPSPVPARNGMLSSPTPELNLPRAAAGSPSPPSAVNAVTAGLQIPLGVALMNAQDGGGGTLPAPVGDDEPVRVASRKLVDLIQYNKEKNAGRAGGVAVVDATGSVVGVFDAVHMVNVVAASCQKVAHGRHAAASKPALNQHWETPVTDIIRGQPANGNLNAQGATLADAVRLLARYRTVTVTGSGPGERHHSGHGVRVLTPLQALGLVLRYFPNMFDTLGAIQDYPTWVTRRIPAVTRTTSVIDALMLIQHEAIPTIAVEGMDGRLVGEFEAADVQGLEPKHSHLLTLSVDKYLSARRNIHLKRSSGTAVAFEATRNAIACTTNTDLRQVAGMMHGNGAHQMYIVNRQGSPTGMVTVPDLLQVIANSVQPVRKPAAAATADEEDEEEGEECDSDTDSNDWSEFDHEDDQLAR